MAIYDLNETTPYIAVHPGEVIKDELKERGITQKMLASMTGVPASVVNEIIRGKRDLNASYAIAFSKILEIPAESLMRLQNVYDLDVARINDKEVEEISSENELMEYNKAFDKFMEGLKYNEENSEIYYKLGRCNCEIKSYQDAISHFKRAISIAPQESKYYFGLGYAYDEIGDIKNSKTAFFDAINIDPLNIQARKAYAIALTKELEYDNAIEQFKEILKSAPNDADTMYNLALACELTGDKENATQYYKKTLAIQPDHEEAKHNLELLNNEISQQY